MVGKSVKGGLALFKIKFNVILPFGPAQGELAQDDISSPPFISEMHSNNT